MDDGPILPPETRDVWVMFQELSSRRTAGFSTVNPLSFTEIDAYARLVTGPLSQVELDWLLACDNTYLAYARYSAASAVEQEYIDRQRADDDG